MKLYDFELAPNPRRVRMFLAEKGITLPMVQVNLRHGEQFGEDFKRDNPAMLVPALVLDDGSLLTETMAICRYFEALQPQPPLFGTTPREQADVEMWSRRAELEGFLAVAEALRNSVERFKDRALPGPRNYAQIPALVERGKSRARAFLDDLEARLATHACVTGDAFTVADITAFVTVEFAGWVDVKPAAHHTALQRWHAAIAARPSAKA
ncbi:MAG: glutathione S-transferase [Gammaproteobacteria bacterium]|nr:glutathione S-transferase [Gammaproteobacteria bacterium]